MRHDQPTPPPRAPVYEDVEAGHDSPHGAACALIARFVAAARRYPDWTAPKNGLEARLSILSERPDGATIAFHANRGDGRIELGVGPDDWVRVEVFLGEALWTRAWAECGYEEPEFWPDGADGEHHPWAMSDIGEAGARMSKRFRWITFFHWPGWETFSVEAVEADGALAP